jgi:hypothetical protein
MRLVKVGLWQLTDQELDDLAAAADATDPCPRRRIAALEELAARPSRTSRSLTRPGVHGPAMTMCHERLMEPAESNTGLNPQMGALRAHYFRRERERGCPVRNSAAMMSCTSAGRCGTVISAWRLIGGSPTDEWDKPSRRRCGFRPYFRTSADAR